MQTKTPGFTCRLVIRFSADKNGKPLAHRWSTSCARYFRVGYDEALLWIAQDQADRA